MINLFRKIRYNLMASNKTERYVKYAFGEIALVVIGILLALALNDWNSKRLEQADIREYYPKLIAELDGQIRSEERRLLKIEEDLELIEAIQKSISTNNRDSFRVAMAGLTALEFDWHAPRNHPLFEEFLAKNYYSKVEDEVLESNVRNLSQLIEAHNRYMLYAEDIHRSFILPFIKEHLDYSKIRESEHSELHGPDLIDYDTLFDHREFRNILAMRAKILQTERSMSGGALYVFGQLKDSLSEGLD